MERLKNIYINLLATFHGHFKEDLIQYMKEFDSTMTNKSLEL